MSKNWKVFLGFLVLFGVAAGFFAVRKMATLPASDDKYIELAIAGVIFWTVVSVILVREYHRAKEEERLYKQEFSYLTALVERPKMPAVTVSTTYATALSGPSELSGRQSPGQ